MRDYYINNTILRLFILYLLQQLFIFDNKKTKLNNYDVENKNQIVILKNIQLQYYQFLSKYHVKIQIDCKYLLSLNILYF
jgi:hypothetical protein